MLDLTDYSEARGVAYRYGNLWEEGGSHTGVRQSRWEGAELLASSLPVSQFDTLARLLFLMDGDAWMERGLQRCIEFVKVEVPALVECIVELAPTWRGTLADLLSASCAILGMSGPQTEAMLCRNADIDFYRQDLSLSPF